MATIGIDLGTTYSCVAAFIPDKVKIIPNAVGSNITPSVVAFKEDSEIIIGEAARSEGLHEPRNAIFNVKRLICKRLDDAEIQEHPTIWPLQIPVLENENGAVVVDGKNYSAKFLSTQILRYLKEQAETVLNAEAKIAVVTVPTYFNEDQKGITRDACEDAGLEVLQLITEPTAAAISYYCELGKIEGEKTCLIFDLGGSTLDIAFVTYKDKHIKILKIGGHPNLGGENFDKAMYEYCLEEFRKKHQIDVRRPQGALTNVGPEKVARNLGRLKMECEKQKCFLSSAKSVVVRLDKFHGELDLVVPITQETFEELNKMKFQRCLTLVKQNLEECGLRKEEIDDIVLVGGSTRIPRVQQLLTEYFGKRLTKNINADEAVAFGAAMQAHYLANPGTEETVTVNPVIEHPDFPMTEEIEELRREFTESNSKIHQENETLRKDLSIEREKRAKEMKELRAEITESNAKIQHENETLRKDLSMEREERSKLASSVTDLEGKLEILFDTLRNGLSMLASSVTDLEGKMEILLNHLGKELSIKNIPSGLLSFQNTEEFAVAVILKNSTSANLLNPNSWCFHKNTREYFPMPQEIPPFSQHGFGFTWKPSHSEKYIGDLFSFQIDETRFVARYRTDVAYNAVGLAFVPSNHPVDENLNKEIFDKADWSKSPEKSYIKVWHNGKDGQKEKIETRLLFGSFCAEATMTIAVKSILNIEIKTIPK